jgi:hypothetical protein
MTRRRSLLALAVPALLAGRAAHAYKERPASAADTEAWLAACRPLPLDQRRTLSADAAEQVNICPFCGCPVVGALDHGEGGARPPG